MITSVSIKSFEKEAVQMTKGHLSMPGFGTSLRPSVIVGRGITIDTHASPIIGHVIHCNVNIATSLAEYPFGRDQAYLLAKSMVAVTVARCMTWLDLMVGTSCIKRLQKEYRALCKEPVSHIVTRPSPNDILEWHYVLEGSEGTPFAGGYYHGKIKFPPEYPFKPPGISMITPNGRFITQKKICLSMSDFHPESWNPMWSVSSILTGLLSFMMDNSPTTGSVSTTAAEKQRLAKASLAFNCRSLIFRKMFPEFVEKYNQQQLAEQSISEQPLSVPLPTMETDAQVHAILRNGTKQGSQTNAGTLNDTRNNNNNRRGSKKFPVWVLLLLVSVFGIVMALPLLQP